MKKFLVVYSASISAREQISKTTPEQAKAGMALWMTWMQKAGPAIVNGGSPLGDASRLADGKLVDHASLIGGFTILQAESREALAELLADHPHLHARGAAIEVHEFLQMPGM